MRNKHHTEAYWRKKQVAAIGEAIKLVTKQTGIQPRAVLWEVMQYLDPTDEGGERHGQDLHR